MFAYEKIHKHNHNGSLACWHCSPPLCNIWGTSSQYTGNIITKHTTDTADKLFFKILFVRMSPNQFILHLSPDPNKTRKRCGIPLCYTWLSLAVLGFAQIGCSQLGLLRLSLSWLSSSWLSLVPLLLAWLSLAQLFLVRLSSYLIGSSPLSSVCHSCL